MPFGRNARQQRGRRHSTASETHTPRIDVFGTIHLGEYEGRVRLIEYAPNTFAAFSAHDPEHPFTFQVDEYHLKGRNLKGTLAGGTGEFVFQKAGCGCETPHNLRGARRPLLQHIPQVDELLQPDTGHPLEVQEYPTPDELTQQVLEL